MSYRPITDIWILARPKVKYYGAYPNGFLERAKVLLGGVSPTLHICGGQALAYPNRRYVENDYTLDADPAQNPDYCQNALDTLPPCPMLIHEGRWPSILIDPPYTDKDAEHYALVAGPCPPANALLSNALKVVRVGGRVGMLHYVLPQPPREGVKFVACVGVIVGYNNRIRCFSVFERTA